MSWNLEFAGRSPRGRSSVSEQVLESASNLQKPGPSSGFKNRFDSIPAMRKFRSWRNQSNDGAIRGF